MAYYINRFSYNNQETVAVVQDGAINTTLDIKLVGRNLFSYGELQNENFLYLLENFAGDEPPPKAIIGQLWYSTLKETLSVCTGVDSNIQRWRELSVIVSNVEPVNKYSGLFWYDTGTNVLKIYMGSWLNITGANSGATVSSDGNAVDIKAGQNVVATFSSTDNTSSGTSRGITIRDVFGLRIGNWYETTNSYQMTFRYLGTEAAPAIIPYTTNKYNLGSETKQWNMVYATATQSLYADLAEKYLADATYEVGTVVMVGGSKEVTACTMGAKALGVVSGKPAYMMNSGLDGGTYIALKGRVPVAVSGRIRKGDEISCGDGGVGVASSEKPFGIALESFDGVSGFIEVVVL